ncbi:hypothetical protein CDL12_21668 [Handroanthus impetiginosus]|uniref:Gibberellin regulated protein n=1 Tax=Handroanthus impetiginosus TaxID=429701 RepID=A0A2G9GKI0_9LAMI|nr:hypothetical protein CDL12_21668 [Handroanthus impetiginosus]
MAIKSTLFLLALVLLVARMGLSVEDIDTMETEHHHHHYAKAPTKAPVHAPAKAPFHAPKKAIAHAPAQPPVHAYSPVSPPHGCVAMCASYCKAISPKRPCMRTCTACCSKSKCVPGFMKCNNWDEVTIHGYLVKCP